MTSFDSPEPERRLPDWMPLPLTPERQPLTPKADIRPARSINLHCFQVARSDIAREVNSRIVLNVVRARQPLSRAELARLTRLQRSTVSLIAEQLVRDHWLVEGEMGKLPRGRRPTLLRINDAGPRFLGLSLRPKVCRLAIANSSGLVLDVVEAPTEPVFEAWVKSVSHSVAALLRQHAGDTSEATLGISVPGFLDPATGNLRSAPRLGWRDVPLRDAMMQATGIGVEVECAANACAMAETMWGEAAAEGEDSVMALVSADGELAAGFMVNGQPIRGHTGMAGCLGPALEALLTGEKFPPESPFTWERYLTSLHRSPSDAETEQPNEFEGEREPAARLHQRFGNVIALLTGLLEPARLVIGGDLAPLWPEMRPAVEEAFSRVCGPAGSSITRIRAAPSQEWPFVEGALALALSKHFGAPAIA